MTSQQYDAGSLDIEGWLGSTALLLIVLYFLVPSLASFHMFSLVAGTIALVSGLGSSVRELFERHTSWLGLVLPLASFAWGVYMLSHLPVR
ncbi:hypothetical protein [Burkholderia gladioli]|uniref:hypothetical protein n=1 Tax=Burkholderia gladioli TaxID=28095 RepID=UPI00163E179A|nr:hypothetical protein [Burkholderia gladioli]